MSLSMQKARIGVLAVAITHLLAVFGHTKLSGTATVAALLGGLVLVAIIRILTRKRRRDLPGG